MGITTTLVSRIRGTGREGDTPYPRPCPVPPMTPTGGNELDVIVEEDEKKE